MEKTEGFLDRGDTSVRLVEECSSGAPAATHTFRVVQYVPRPGGVKTIESRDGGVKTYWKQQIDALLENLFLTKLLHFTRICFPAKSGNDALQGCT